MGDLVLRTSLLVQRGYLCQSCGVELAEEPAGRPRSCDSCAILENQQATDAEDIAAGPSRLVIPKHQ